MNYFFLFFILTFNQLTLSETFNVGLTIIPDLNPITNQINNGNYISLHLYYPLFNFDSDFEKVDSNFLDMSRTKSKNLDFKNYIFCLKQDIKFSDESPISSAHLKKSLQTFSLMYPHMIPLKSVTILDNRCVQLNLKSSLPGLFRKLTGVSSTILKDPTSISGFPIGYGPYKVSERNSDNLIISYAGKTQPRFNKIKFYIVTDKEKNVKFHDANQLPPRETLIDISNLQELKAPSYKVYANVLNILDEKRRATYFNLLQKMEWAKIYNLKLKAKERFLPLNDEPKKFIKNISVAQCSKIRPIALIVVNLYSTKLLENELKKNSLDSCFKIHLLSPSNFVTWAFSGKEYIGMMAFDSSGSISSLEGDFSVYFESFFSEKNRVLSLPLNTIKKYVENAQKISLSPREKLDFFIRAESFLLDNYYIQPIGQTFKNFYFPEDINIVEWFDFYSGIPKVDSIK